MTGFFASTPIFWGDGKIAPNFDKNLTVPFWRVVVTRRFNRRKLEIHYKNIQVSLYPFLRIRGGLVGGTEQSTACYDVSRNSSPRLKLLLLLLLLLFIAQVLLLLGLLLIIKTRDLTCRKFKQEAQLSPRDRAMHRVN